MVAWETMADIYSRGNGEETAKLFDMGLRRIYAVYLKRK